MSRNRTTITATVIGLVSALTALQAQTQSASNDAVAMRTKFAF